MFLILANGSVSAGTGGIGVGGIFQLSLIPELKNDGGPGQDRRHFIV